MFLLVGSISFTNFAFAYEKENHYWLKIALALNCGFTLDEARLIGVGDFSIDEDSDTQPVRSGSDKSNPKWKWHALPTENPDVDKNEVSSGNQQIKQRQHELYERAMGEKNTPLKLFKFGQYLHYQEDKWSHWGYTTGMGHAVPNVVPGMDSPDETHANPDHYRYMVFDSMVNLGKLAKSLGKDTQCVSDLVPLDTYKSAPEYGKDFPWFSPQEIKRAKDPLKFQKDVNQHLSDWGKSALINEVIQASDDRGDEGVTESFVSYIAKKTGVSKSDIVKKYDYINVDIDESGNTKKLPDNLIKSASPKEDKKAKKGKMDSAQFNQLKNSKQKSMIPDTKKTTNIKPKNTQPKKTEKPVIQKEPATSEPKSTNTKPSLTVPKQLTREATGPSGAAVSFDVSGQDKEDGALAPTCDHSSGSVFPIGTTTVSCTVKDSNNNSISGTFTVTVRDTTPPDIAPFQPTEGVRDETGVQVFFEATAHDLVDGNVPTSCNYPSGYKFPPGTTNLTCTASDSRGNQASRTLQITVTITESGQ
jgi:hypothetical protein